MQKAILKEVILEQEQGRQNIETGVSLSVLST